MDQSLLKVAVLLVTLAFIFYLTFSFPDGSSETKISGQNEVVMEKIKKMVLGSRPPGCVNKCMHCNPCLATLVISHKDQTRVFRTSSREEDDGHDSYYLVSWRCKCGDKLFEP